MDAEILYKNETEITDSDLIYYESQVLDLAEKSEFEIEYYIDSEVLNPQVIEYAQSQAAGLEVSPLSEEDNKVGLNAFGTADFLTLKARDEARTTTGGRRLFSGLKEKVRKIFCDAVRSIQGVDIKDIIKAAIVAAIPAFTGGFAALLLPIVIGLIAYFAKFGFTKLCPIN